MSRPAEAVAPGWLAATDDAPAIVEPGRGVTTYRELDRLADAVARRLARLGVGPGDRVGLYLRRSADAIAAILGILRAGAAWVPVDPAAPALRNAEILADCGVRLTIIEERLAAAYHGACAARVGASEAVEVIGEVGAGRSVAAWTAEDRTGATFDPPAPSTPAVILYTSGSTGRPKGWTMTRQAIAVHAGWVHGYLRASRRDVFANHAQLNFGMSLFDVFSSLGIGATLVLVPDEIRLLAAHVVELWARERVTIWFSAPVILGLVAEVPDIEAHDLSALRVIAFAGERFPAPRLERLRSRVQGPRYCNFYGATELNVAAAYELPRDRHFDEPPPIGRPCAHYESRIVAEDGRPPVRGQAGELQLRGPGLDTGYLGRPDLDPSTFVRTAGEERPWYRTGDLVVVEDDGDLRYAGRLGRMVKVKGYRVEPGEIEVRLNAHPGIRESAVVAVEGPAGTRLVAHLGAERMPVVQLKLHCSQTLPPYMVPERFVFHERLPRNLRGKIDYAALQENGESAGSGSPSGGATPDGHA